jgi:hypothetical protein
VGTQSSGHAEQRHAEQWHAEQWARRTEAWISTSVSETKNKKDKNNSFPFFSWRATRSLGLETHVVAIRTGELKTDDTH